MWITPSDQLTDASTFSYHSTNQLSVIASVISPVNTPHANGASETVQPKCTLKKTK